MKEIFELWIQDEWAKNLEVRPIAMFKTMGRITLMPISEFLEDGRDMRDFNKALRAVRFLENATEIGWVSEGWHASFKSKDQVKSAMAEHKEVRLIPERIESVTLMLYTKMSTRLINYAIDRTLAPPKLVPWSDDEGAIGKENGLLQNPFLD